MPNGEHATFMLVLDRHPESRIVAMQPRQEPSESNSIALATGDSRASNIFENERPPTIEVNPAAIPDIGTKHAMTVKRPFMPTLLDELAVMQGDTVAVLEVYEDGWAKICNGRLETGFVPLDCFRVPDRSVPAFLAQKRKGSLRICPPVLECPSSFSPTEAFPFSSYR
jgi:hypothetical protein